ncbi:MAG: U32 family peptidase [Deltaproteobacteria bacterium]|nr:U32 family peptidase [Deltaproteobacteria bacterium]
MLPRLPEVLAPAGDAAALRAAIRAGADAVYLGLRAFSARARATNFDEAGLCQAMRELHEHGAKGYVTLNTLVCDDEMADLERAVRACVAAGADAVIVQDLGVARLVRELVPELVLHASTQMTCTDLGAIALARGLGVRRVALARELSLAEIERLAAASDVELEVFVHGALCISYSGQCLASAALGGRSANRGLCAQPCRLPYELVVDGAVADLGNRAYLLSPFDLEASHLVRRLAEAGVASLKIEGRLKSAPYVLAAVRLYRQAVDALGGQAPAPSEAVRRAALQVYSRGSGPGWLEGVDHQRLVDGALCEHRGLEIGTALGVGALAGKRCISLRLSEPLARGQGILIEGGWAGAGELGGRVWELLDRHGRKIEAARPGREALAWLGPDVAVRAVPAGRRAFRTSDPAVERDLAAAMDRPYRAPLALRVSGVAGEPAWIEARSLRDGRVARVATEAAVERARGQGARHAAIREKLGRLGKSPFALASLDLDVPEDAFLPASSLNRARRALVAALAAQAVRSHRTSGVTAAPWLEAARPPEREPLSAGLFVLCRSPDQAQAALEAGASGVVLDFASPERAEQALGALRARGAPSVALALPRILRDGEDEIEARHVSLRPDALLLRALGSVGRQDGCPRIGDFSLNVANRRTAAALLGLGLDAFTPAHDLDARRLLALCAAPFAPWAEVVVHARVPLFHTEHCLFAARLSRGADGRSCGRPCERRALALRDRTGLGHPVLADALCRNTVYCATARTAAAIAARLCERGVRRFRIELLHESAAEARSIVQIYRDLLAGRTGGAETERALERMGPLAPLGGG